ncbi:hypothetical protein FRC06_001709 [Ceratobasidium sp. 370]|nr:hypothetical protein FRC06_001709 [Ceratobasidium sp. 370]
MLSRLFAAAPTVAGRRTYSFFSSKPPGGIVKQQSQTNTNVVKRTTPSTPAPTPTPAVSKSASPVAATQAASPSSPAPAEPAPAPTPAPPSPTPIPALHPAPVLATMHLHSFFALDRPMLLLSQPTSQLFETRLPATRAQETDQDGAGETDADADAARALSHALVMSRVRGAVDWKAALEKLGVGASAAEVQEEARVGGDLAVLMDSVKRKRRKKITKHKYKKRRKLQRSERRRLGK